MLQPHKDEQTNQLETAAFHSPRPQVKHDLPIADRKRFSRRVKREVAETRQNIISQIENSRIERFTIPESKAFLDKVVNRLLKGSNLIPDAIGPLYVHLEDAIWGEPAASLNSGVLKVEPELIGTMNDEDEVAAVVAHEIAHHIRAHTEKLTTLFKRIPFIRKERADMFSSREISPIEENFRLKNEKEADILALLLLSNSDYDPYAAIESKILIENEINTDPRYEFQRGRFDPTHPPVRERLRYLTEALNTYDLKERPRTTEGFLAVITELGERSRPSYPETKGKDLYLCYSRARSH